jgi:hypothetical protein
LQFGLDARPVVRLKSNAASADITMTMKPSSNQYLSYLAHTAMSDIPCREAAFVALARGNAIALDRRHVG